MRGYWFLAIGVTLLAAFARPAGAQQPPAFLRLDDIRQDAAYVANSKLLDHRGGTYDPDLAAAVLERAQSCLKGIDEALGAKIPATKTLVITVHGDDGDDERSMALSEIQGMCHEAVRLAAPLVFGQRIAREAAAARVWVADLRSGTLSEDQAGAARDQGRSLLKVIAQAQEAGFPDSAAFDIDGEPMTLAQLKELGEYVGSAGGRLKDSIEESRLAKDEPFLKALSGDRLQVFRDEFAGNDGSFECFGHGMRPLETPRALSSSNVWYVWGVEDGVWHVRGWVFAGNKILRTYYRQGLGSRAPAAAFP